MNCVRLVHSLVSNIRRDFQSTSGTDIDATKKSLFVIRSMLLAPHKLEKCRGGTLPGLLAFLTNQPSDKIMHARRWHVAECSQATSRLALHRLHSISNHEWPPLMA